MNKVKLDTGYITGIRVSQAGQKIQPDTSKQTIF